MVIRLTTSTTQRQEEDEGDLHVVKSNIAYYKASKDCTLVYVKGIQAPLTVKEKPEQIHKMMRRK